MAVTEDIAHIHISNGKAWNAVGTLTGSQDITTMRLTQEAFFAYSL